MSLGPAQPENRVAWPGAHGREAVSGGAAKQIEQDGLRLVVRGVAGSNRRRQGAQPRRARPRLEIGTWSDRDPVNDDLDAESDSDVAHDLGVLVRTSSQPVVDVIGDDVTAGDDGEHQQGEGVGAAGDGAGEWRSRVGKRAPPDESEATASCARCPQGVRHAGSGVGPRTRDTQRSGARISAAARQILGARQASARSSGPPVLSTRARTARRRHIVAAWPRARSAARRPRQPTGGFAPRTENLREVLGVRDQVAGGTVHCDVTVTFEEAHHPLDRTERFQLRRRGESTDEPGLGKRVPARADVDGHACDCFHHLAWVGRRDGNAALDQLEKMSTQPWHAGEWAR